MRLRIGTRVPHDVAELSRTDPPEIQRNRAVYRIVEVIAESPWAGLYRGRKVFRNFDFGKRCLIEVEDDECLDVLLKTIVYPVIDQKEYVSARRDHAWFEAKKVLGCRKTNLIPEPLDFLEVRNDEDGFKFPNSGRSAVREPVMVCEFIYGENLARWRQRDSPNVARSLRILAELLELINVLHGQRVLMNNVSPAAFWADELDRVHFVGTENVIDEAKAQAWRLLFPPERYARGFAAPELCEPNGVPSRESDLFGWASLAYFLITGESPAGLAVQQQRRSPQFGAHERDRLKIALEALDRARLPEFKALFEVGGTRFERTWPDSFVDGLLACLQEDCKRRPPDIPSLRQWWEAAPPASVPSALGISRNGRTSLVFSTVGLPGSLRYAIRRQIGETPRSPNAGVEVWTGGPAAVVEDVVAGPSTPRDRSTALADWCYGIFTIDDRDGTTSVSRVTPIPVVDGAKSGFALSLADELARSAGGEAALSTTELPPTLDLLSHLESRTSLAEELLGSQQEIVRAWSIEILRRRLERLPDDQECRTLLLESGLQDSSDFIRRKSALAAVETAVTCDLSFVIGLAKRLGGSAIEDRIRAARDLTSVGVPQGLAQQAMHALEADRPVACPECGQSVRAGNLDGHLTAAHGYLVVDGKAFPLNEALKKLWSKLLKHFDPQAFAALGMEFARRHSDQAGAALVDSFRQRFKTLADQPLAVASERTLAKYLDRIAACFHSHELGKFLCRQLLTDSNARLRDLGRRFFLPGVAEMYAGNDSDPGRFRRSIDFLLPNGHAGEKIRFCRLLATRGADPVVAGQVEQDLEGERLEPCPECGESIMRRGLPRHRRVRHGVFELDGVRHSWESLVTALVGRVVVGDSGLYAAQTLVEVHQERFGAEAPAEVARLLTARFHEAGADASKPEQIRCAARSLAPVSLSPSICRCALATTDPIAQAFGLNLFAHFGRCDDLDLLRTVATMCGQSEISLETRTLAAENLLRVGAEQFDLCRESLTRLAHSAPGDALAKIDLLQSLKQRIGESSIVDDVCRKLEEGRRIRCTKCGGIFNGHEMEEHAVRAHGLVFDGRLLRQPWAVAMECLDNFIATSNRSLLERAESFSEIGSASGQGHLCFVREALRRGVDPGTYRQTLEAAAAKSNESICPSCFTSLTSPTATPIPVVLKGNNELASSYLRIRRIGNEKFVYQYEIDADSRTWTGRQPMVRPTRRGAVLAVLAAFCIPAIIFAVVSLMPTPGAMDVAKECFVASALGAIAVVILYHPRCASALDLAWSFVVPELLVKGLDQGSMAFLRGLSLASFDSGRPLARRRPLAGLIEEIKRDVAAGDLDPACLGEAVDLLRADLQATKASPAELLRFYASLLADFVGGSVMQSMVDSVTKAGRHLTSLPLEIQIALRWRLLESAHEQGWSAADVMQLAESSAAIRALLSADPPATSEVVAAVWAVIEASRQRTMFPQGAKLPVEMIERGELKTLRDYPDLLLTSKDGRVYVDSNGFWFDNNYFSSPPSISVDTVTQFVQTGWTYQRLDGGPDMRYNYNPPVGTNRVVGYDVTIDGTTKRHDSNPQGYLELLKDYSNFVFQRLRPCAAEAAHALPTGKARLRLAGRPVRCPQCHRSLRFLAGRFADRVSDKLP